MPNHIQNRVTVDAEIIDQYLTDGKFDFNLVVPQPPELVIESVDTQVMVVAEIAMGKIQFNTPEPEGGRSAALERGEYGSLANVMHLQNAQRVLIEQKLANEFDDKRFEEFIACLRSIRATGFPSWYEWNTQHWGTKWGAYEFERQADNMMTFQTAWSAPHKIIGKMFEAHECEILHEWADEDTGNNVGRVKYTPGAEPDVTDLAQTKEGYELAFELDGEKPDYYQYNETLGTYEYVETADT